MPKATVVLKLPLEVNSDTASILNGQSKICNWLYNHLLEKALQLKQEFIKTQNPETAKLLLDR